MSLPAYDIDRLPRGEHAFPGPLRDQLVAAILDGRKTATSSLVEDYVREGEPLPQVGDLEVVLDSAGRVVCVTRNVAVVVRRLGDVVDEHAHREGEGHVDAAAWRRGHESFWTSPECVAERGDPPLVLADDTEIVCVTFEVLERR
ncbi:ASCH domain-containing protein [Arsenicicoccus dermatophilus]|uniref:ASCH domain-containing protein n=1 Tax=Arsenicicoccus dermatophilus TaxID=1076331 RepID=UPI003916F818